MATSLYSLQKMNCSKQTTSYVPNTVENVVCSDCFIIYLFIGMKKCDYSVWRLWAATPMLDKSWAKSGMT